MLYEKAGHLVTIKSGTLIDYFLPGVNRISMIIYTDMILCNYQLKMFLKIISKMSFFLFFWLEKSDNHYSSLSYQYEQNRFQNDQLFKLIDRIPCFIPFREMTTLSLPRYDLFYICYRGFSAHICHRMVLYPSPLFQKIFPNFLRSFHSVSYGLVKKTLLDTWLQTNCWQDLPPTNTIFYVNNLNQKRNSWQLKSIFSNRNIFLE